LQVGLVDRRSTSCSWLHLRASEHLSKVADLVGQPLILIRARYDQNYYQTRPSSNPKSPFNGKHRVLRGGSFMDKADGLRVTRRNWDLPSSRFKNFGFRCAKSKKRKEN